LVFTIIANVFGVSDNGRLFLVQGKVGNPNEMAQALLLSLPLWGAIMVISKTPPGKLFAAGVMVLILATTFRTGSRGAMIGFLVMLLVVFLRAPVLGKVKIIMAGILFVVIVLTTMPGKLISRYKTVAVEEMDDSEIRHGDQRGRVHAGPEKTAVAQSALYHAASALRRRSRYVCGGR
jgi:O-antigen ligase